MPRYLVRLTGVDSCEAFASVVVVIVVATVDFITGTYFWFWCFLWFGVSVPYWALERGLWSILYCRFLDRSLGLSRRA